MLKAGMEWNARQANFTRVMPYFFVFYNCVSSCLIVYKLSLFTARHVVIDKELII